MGGGKGGSQNTTTTNNNVTSTQLPDWLNNASAEAVNRAVALSNQTPVPYYQGQQVADQSGMTQQAYQQIQNLQGSANPAFTTSAGIYQGLLGGAPLTPRQQNDYVNQFYGNYRQGVATPAADYLNNAQRVSADYLNSAQNASAQGYQSALGNSQGYYGNAQDQARGLLGGYLASAGPATAAQVGANATTLMSPYRDDVINPALAAGQQQLALAKQRVAGNANAAGAFGGSRQGVEEGVADAQTALGTQQFIGNMLNQGWGQALTPAYGLASQASQQGYNAAGLLSGQGFNEAANLAQQQYGAAGALGQQQYGAAGALGQQGYGSAADLAQMLGQGYAGAGAQNQALFNADLQAAQQLPGQAAAQAVLNQQQTGALQAAGTDQQAYTQQQIDAEMGNWAAQYQQPYQNLYTLLAAVGAVPYGTTGTTDGTNNVAARTNPGLLNTITGYAGLVGKVAGAAAAGAGGGGI